MNSHTQTASFAKAENPLTAAKALESKKKCLPPIPTPHVSPELHRRLGVGAYTSRQLNLSAISMAPRPIASTSKDMQHFLVLRGAMVAIGVMAAWGIYAYILG